MSVSSISRTLHTSKWYADHYVVVRHLGSGKPITTFSEASLYSIMDFSRKFTANILQASDLQAEKRGNFVVIGCVDGTRVVSWSLNVCFALF